MKQIGMTIGVFGVLSIAAAGWLVGESEGDRWAMGADARYRLDALVEERRQELAELSKPHDEKMRMTDGGSYITRFRTDSPPTNRLEVYGDCWAIGADSSCPTNRLRIMHVESDRLQLPVFSDNIVFFGDYSNAAPLVISTNGVTYNGRFVEDAGEVYRLMIDVLSGYRMVTITNYVTNYVTVTNVIVLPWIYTNYIIQHAITPCMNSAWVAK
jgi:hypothetical protein